MCGGLRLPSVWSGVAVEAAWAGVGQFATLWALARQVAAARAGAGRAAALALVSRTALLPRSAAAAGAGASAYSDLLLFERSMRRGWVQYAEGGWLSCCCGFAALQGWAGASSTWRTVRTDQLPSISPPLQASWHSCGSTASRCAPRGRARSCSWPPPRWRASS